eukprot:4286001-Pleurochrysis_carterae.AAC.1
MIIVVSATSCALALLLSLRTPDAVIWKASTTSTMSLFVALAAASAAAAATTAKSGPAPAGKEAPKKTFTVTTSPIELRYAQ